MPFECETCGWAAAGEPHQVGGLFVCRVCADEQARKPPSIDPGKMPPLPPEDDEDEDTPLEPTPLWEPKPPGNPLKGLDESRPEGPLPKPYWLPRGSRGRRRLA